MFGRAALASSDDFRRFVSAMPQAARKLHKSASRRQRTGDFALCGGWEKASGVGFESCERRRRGSEPAPSHPVSIDASKRQRRRSGFTVGELCINGRSKNYAKQKDGLPSIPLKDHKVHSH
ncbi:UL3.5 [anatid alphaherpesvirus 1]|uniref:UL3.5 n=1 Tax=anatid alphaherpesvirus 1 TaxID=104388 RepID=G3GR39_9ALPH|nr:UL3.5 [Anatid alphaherpesvirus 1]AEN80121.1 UL3.5 [Anatid alphaherpesvirus 1]QOL71501.1 UL3.5 [Anatid alphaherpesvirus 1]UEC79340.1 UL3.5 [Anatid alphaherpesvirus 1]UJO49853.1 UL3.5 [Anatid alphaherpesvirus 1]UJO49928.1 UL3.5 [Anatid alphaherpesvirus 1]